MNIAVIQISEAGSTIAQTLQRELGAKTIQRVDVGSQWKQFDAFVFIGAMGICVRTIAPYIEDKHIDPAVVCVDSFGNHVISVLSGHIGGANDLTKHIAGALGVDPIITTQSDNAGLWALDIIYENYDWQMSYVGNLNTAIGKFVNREPVALLLDIRDEGTDYLERTCPQHVTIVNTVDEIMEGNYSLAIVVSPFIYSNLPSDLLVVQYTPQVLDLGIGLAHQAPVDTYEDIQQLLSEHNIYLWSECIRNICTIDIKAEEPVIQKFQKERYGLELKLYTADELAKVDVPTPSEMVEKHVGTPSVCEAAAILGSNYGKLLLPKVKGKNFTLAVAIDRKYLREGHIEIVGAGPGDPDLVSVRGRKMLERADLILYAGSLVPKALTDCHKSGAIVRSSADMNLEEQCALMKEHYDKGHFIVRLHTGDPCIFGAIQEQMAFFDANGMDYHITPGISSFLAAAAELQSQFTIPERCQTIILTRGEGRTPMPEKEKLHLLAKSQSTMCIFLSAAIVDDVQKELLQEYPEDTPVAACYHLTWPDQKIYRGKLKDLAKIVHDNHLTLTTMLVVGEAIDNRSGLSELYSKHFTHLFRQGDDNQVS
ncbi:MAG: precorrin-4 C(11)-methyltransferase [Prevotella sp.]|jgi:precorrin-4 C11-methyltransferase|nr:precorrin-4 C(11)-methyltransferase [Prevotella sp.]